MIQLQPEVFLDWAGKVTRLKLYPYFDIAHYAIMCMSVKDDLATGAQSFSRKHPFACWLSSMVMCFAGSFLANFLLGEPVIVPLKRQDDVILASIVWYFVFYSPFDLVGRLIRFFPIKLVASLAKEVTRAHKIHVGVNHAAKVYPNAYLVMVLIGTAKGAGSGIIRIMEQLIRGIWVPSANEFLRPTFYTKASIIASIVFVIEKRSTYLAGYPHEVVYFTVVAFLVYFKLMSMLFHIHDPFAPFENLFCAICMGGVWDALSRAVSAGRGEGATTTPTEDSTSETKKDQ